MSRAIFEPDHDLFRDTVRSFVAAEFAPNVAGVDDFRFNTLIIEELHAFDQPISSFQPVQHTMAEMRTELDIVQTYVDSQIMALVEGELTPEEAAKTKWWVTDLENRVISGCLQLFGGWGYMEEYPIARAFRDARVQTIYGGTTEIMKEIIAKSLGL